MISGVKERPKDAAPRVAGSSYINFRASLKRFGPPFGLGINSGKLYPATGSTFTRHFPCAQVICGDEVPYPARSIPRSTKIVQHASDRCRTVRLQTQQAYLGLFLLECGFFFIFCLTRL